MESFHSNTAVISTSANSVPDGQPMSVEVTLNEGWEAAEPPKPNGYEGYLGMTLENWSENDGLRGSFKKRVVSKVHSLGPAHKAHIASTQTSLYRMGDVVLPIRVAIIQSIPACEARADCSRNKPPLSVRSIQRAL